MNEEQLVKACLQKVASAQSEFYHRFARKMMGVCLRYGGTVQNAEDLLQDGFIKVFEVLNTYRFEGSLEGWVRKIIVNNTIYQLRSKVDFTVSGLDERYHTVSDSGVQSDEKLQGKDLLKLVQQLPSGYRVVFNLYAIEGYSHKEIADKLGLSEGTSKSQYSRAKNLLQKQLEYLSYNV